MYTISLEEKSGNVYNKIQTLLEHGQKVISQHLEEAQMFWQ
jgi:hypothetical protein